MKSIQVNRIRIISFVVSIVFVLAACTGKLKSPEQFYSWMNNPENGLVKKETVGPIDYTVKYLSPDFLAYSEWVEEEDSSMTLRDLIDEYDNSFTFLFTVAPNESAGDVDIMKAGVMNYEQYADRVYELNFNLADAIQLDVDGVQLSPVLTRLENIYGMSNQRNFYIVFAPIAGHENIFKGAKDITFSYVDPIFETGISQFKFNGLDFKEIPELSFVQKNINK